MSAVAEKATKKTLSQLVQHRLPVEKTILKFLKPVHAQITTAIDAQDDVGALTYIARGVTASLTPHGVTGAFTVPTLIAFVTQHGWAPIYDAADDTSHNCDNARVAITSFLAQASGRNVVNMGERQPAPAANKAPQNPTPESREAPRPSQSQAPTNDAQRPAGRPTATYTRNESGGNKSQRQDGFKPQHRESSEVAKPQGATTNEELHIVTPVGEALFPYLEKPDYEFHPEGIYHTYLLFQPHEIKDLLEQLIPLRDRLFDKKYAEYDAIARDPRQTPKDQAKAEANRDKLVKVDIVKTEINDQNRPTGKMMLHSKSKASGKLLDGTPYERKPRAYDADVKQLQNMPPIAGKSRLALSVIARPYFKPNTNGQGGGDIGITMYLEGVQIIKLVSSSPTGENDGFKPNGQQA